MDRPSRFLVFEKRSDGLDVLVVHEDAVIVVGSPRITGKQLSEWTGEDSSVIINPKLNQTKSSHP